MNKKMCKANLFKMGAMVFMAGVLFSNSLFADIITEDQADTAASKLIARERAFLKKRLDRLERIIGALKSKKSALDQTFLTVEQTYKSKYKKKLKKKVEQRIKNIEAKISSLTKSKVTPIYFPLKTKRLEVGYIVELENIGYIVLSGVSELPVVTYHSFSGKFDDFKDSEFYKTIKKELYDSKKKLGYFDIHGATRINRVVLSSPSDEITWPEILGQNELPVLNGPEPLFTSEWHQVAPFNNLAPVLDSKQANAGSAAVAQGIVMKYWEWPKSRESKFKDGQNQCELSLKVNYPWEGMEKNGTHVAFAALLLRQIGASLDMNYTKKNSLSVFSKCKNSLWTCFGYDEDSIDTNNWSGIEGETQSWFCNIQKEIDAGRPCLLLLRQTGTRQKPKKLNSFLKTQKPTLNSLDHVVVIDGYRYGFKCKEIHLNMGWGGSHNNYYDINDIVVPPARDDDANFYEIPPGKPAIIGIIPNKSLMDLDWRLKIRQELLEKISLSKNQ